MSSLFIDSHPYVVEMTQQIADMARVVITSTGADIYLHRKIGSGKYDDASYEWVQTETFVYAGTETFRGFNTSSSATIPGQGLYVGDTFEFGPTDGVIYFYSKGATHVAEISKIKLPTGTEYDLKDAWARQQIEAITGGSAIVFKGVSSTPLTDGGTERPTIDGSPVTDITVGDLYFYGTDEFIWGANETWQELGPSLTILGDLAYADTASASYTPGGSVSLSNTNKTATVSPAGSGTVTYTPAGIITGSTFTGASMTATGSFTPDGSVESTFTGASMTSTGTFTPSGNVSLTDTNKTATVSPAGSGTATYTPAGTITGAAFTGASMTSTGSFTPDGTVSSTFTGASMTSTGKFTPSGSVSFTNSNQTATVSKASSGTATYTPEGSVTAPTISVASAGSTTTIHNPTKATVATSVNSALPTASSVAGTAVTYCSVADETLSLYKLGYSTGDSITTSDVTVKTGDASYSATAPTFSGTGARLVTGNISVPSSATFNGTEGNVSVSGTTTGSVTSEFTGEADTVSVSGTTTGSVSQGTFNGTGVRLVTGNIAVPTSASFTGTAGNISVSGTTTGSVSSEFTGEADTVTVTGTTAGSVSQGTFTGTGVRLVTDNIAVPNGASFTGTPATITVTPDS